MLIYTCYCRKQVPLYMILHYVLITVNVSSILRLQMNAYIYFPYFVNFKKKVDHVIYLSHEQKYTRNANMHLKWQHANKATIFCVFFKIDTLS